MKTNELRVRRFFNYFYGAFAFIHLYAAFKTYLMVEADDAKIILTFSMLAGMVTYVIALYVNNKGLINVAISLFIAEQTIHQFLLVKYLGLSLGFQMFYFLGPVLLFFSSYRFSIKISIIITIFVAYCLLILYGLGNPPLLHPSLGVVKETLISNAAILFITFSLLAYVYKGSVDIAEQKYLAEQIKTNQLLHNIFPADIVLRLKDNPKKIADKYAETTVLFADLAGFAKLSSSMVPSMLVEIIDDIFCRFDLIVDKYGLEKIKTIGDSYMAAGGVPIESNDHAQLIAEAALEMRQAIYAFNEESHENLDIRIGIHTGPLIAGVIGKKKLTYDIWGDAVNIASRMESHSQDGKIQLSEPTYNLIKKNFLIKERGIINVKGKGEMKTYFLLGKK